MIKGKVAGMDAFGRADKFEKLFYRLLNSYALDALDLYGKNNDGKAPKSPVTSFLLGCLYRGAAYLVKLALDGVEPSRMIGKLLSFTRGISDEWE